MKNRVSCTITVGEGSEKHNHDLRYRASLTHTHTADRPDAIIELIPYRPYNEQINEMMKPYIDEYNRRQQERYHAAWDRYNNGIIKTKPRKRDFKTMDYDYYTEHLNDQVWNPHLKKKEYAPMWREVIFGLGDQKDKVTKKITEEEAVATMRRVVEQWPELFPDFKLLGATIHLDEEGFYHCHIDYKPIYEKPDPERGLDVGVGQEAALEHMGFEPEQSIINGRDKVPIRFNAFRNRLYFVTEEALHRCGLRLWYGVSEVKDPGKNASVNQQLEDWKATQEDVLQIQELKNNAFDVILQDRISPEELKEATSAVKKIESIMTKIDEQPRERKKENRIIPFHLLDQLRSYVRHFLDTIKYLLQQIDVLKHNLREAEQEIEELRAMKIPLANQVTSAEERNTLPGTKEAPEREKNL